MRRFSTILFVALLAIPAGAHTLSAQAHPTRDVLRVLAGGGVLGATDGTLAADAGGLATVMVDLPFANTWRGVAAAVRGGGWFAHQTLRPGASSRGNVQTTAGDFGVRLSLAAHPQWPYALVSGGLARVSTKLDVAVIDPNFPSVEFTQTTSDVSATSAVGLGLARTMGPVALFLEGRVHFASRDEGTVRLPSLVAGLQIPIRR